MAVQLARLCLQEVAGPAGRLAALGDSMRRLKFVSPEEVPMFVHTSAII